MAELPGVFSAAARRPADLSVADSLTGLGFHLHAAEFATAAVRTLRRAGHRGRAGLVAQTAATLRDACPDARTPLLASDDLSSVLTP
jgi:hypothetical protein